MKTQTIISLLLATCLITVLAFAAVSQTSRQTDPWLGKYIFDIEHIKGSVTIEKNDQGDYVAWHCFTDGRIHGGASDCADSKWLPYTMTNVRHINSTTLEFDFVSGYTMTTGVVRLIRVDAQSIRMIMTENHDEFFATSPLANMFYLTDGEGPNAPGGIVFVRNLD